MRTFRRFKKNLGFTLVELMIVVAIIGVLAALAIYGVRRYLASAKTSEAKNTLGSIARSAQGAFEREQNASEILTGGGTGAQLSHDLCASSNPTPANIPAGNKLMPAAGDFETTAAGNSANVGWQCLKFSLSTPVYYQYGYVSQRLNTALPSGESEGSAAIPTSLTDPGTGAFIGYAQGDLDNDGNPSAFGIQGVVEPASKTVSIATQVQIVDEYE